MKLVSRRTQVSSSALPPMGSLEASPRAISRRTSYHRVRLEFLSHPQLIPECCTARGFGPPSDFRRSSSWSWIAHPVSGYIRATKRPLRLAFAAPPPQRGLSIATHNILAGSFFNRNTVTRPDLRRNFRLPLFVSAWFQILFHRPQRAAFHLSLVVLVHYRSLKVFSLRP